MHLATACAAGCRAAATGQARTRWLTTLPGLLAGILAVAGALAATPPPSSPAPPEAALVAGKDGYTLARPLTDFYDSALVLNRPGAAPQVVSVDALADTLLGYDVILFGEIHRHPGVHLQELRLFRALHLRDPKLVLSLEQFERDVQGVVDDYLADRVGEQTLISRGRAWDNYPDSYRPLVSYAHDHQLPVIAAEAPGWAISCIGQQGPAILDHFSPEERSWVAHELHLGPGRYRDKFTRFQADNASHGDGGTSTPEARLRSERSFAAQAARDDTMAESIFLARQKYPGRRVLHLNGSFHSEGFLGTAERLQLREPGLRIAVITPIEVDDARAPSFAAARLADGTALLLVYPSPPEFAEGEDPSEWIRSIMVKRKASTCKYALPDSPR